MTERHISGQLILSDRGQKLRSEETGILGPRHALMVFGLIAVPPEIAARYADPKGWTRYNVRGDEGLDEDFIRHLGLRVYAEPAEPVEDYMRHFRVDQLITAPIWRA